MKLPRAISELPDTAQLLVLEEGSITYILVAEYEDGRRATISRSIFKKRIMRMFDVATVHRRVLKALTT